MDRFPAALIAVSVVYFWLPVCAIVLIAGSSMGLPSFMFGAILVLLAGISCGGSIVCLLELRTYSRLWYFGVALCAVLLIAAAVAVIFFIGQIDGMFSVSPAGQTAARVGQAALLLIAPSSVLFFIAFVPLINERLIILYAIGIAAASSLLSLAMTADAVLFALQVYSTAVFAHPFYEGFLILYGTIATPWIGIMVLAIAFRCRDRTEPGNPVINAAA